MLGSRLAAGLMVALTATALASGSSQGAVANWNAAWQGSPVLGSVTADEGCPQLADQTARDIVTTAIGGTQVRVRISNAYGTAPLTVGAATLAPTAGGAAVDARRLSRVTVGRAATFTIPAGATVLSDPIKLSVVAGGRLSLSVYVPEQVAAMTQHSWSRTTNYVASGNQSTNNGGEGFQPVSCWMLATGVDVLAGRSVTGTVVALGDSLTDGDGSTTDANRRYPDALARRLAALPKSTLSVANAGIAGNRLDGELRGAPYALYPVLGEPANVRLQRDVISQPGATDVIVLLGTVDVTDGTDTDTFIARYTELIARLHAAGLDVHVGTLPPWGGLSSRCSRASSAAACEAQRQQINAWLRDAAPADSVVDFDAAVRDPADPTRLAAEYDAGDHLHFNDAGYARMADAVSLPTLLG